MQPGPAGRGPGKKCPVSPPPSVLLLLRPRAEGTRSQRGGRSGDAAGGAEGVAEGVSAGPGETIQFGPQQVEAGGLPQTFSRFAEKSPEASQTACAPFTPTVRYRTEASPERGTGQRPLRECREAEVRPCRLCAVGNTGGLLVKADCHLPLLREDRASPTSSLLRGPPRSSRPLWGP